MMKKSGRILILLLLLLSVAGCAGQVEHENGSAGISPEKPTAETAVLEEATAVPDETTAETVETAGFPIAYTDATGHESVITERPQRVAVLFSSYAEIWQLAGGTVDITVGDSVSRGFAGEDAILCGEGAGLRLDLEQLVAAEPDLVIGTADLSAQVEAVEMMREEGVNGLLLREETFDDYLGILELFCRILGNGQAYIENGTAVGGQIDTLLETVDAEEREPVTYLLIRAGSGFASTSIKTEENHVACAMLTRLGAENVATEDGIKVGELSVEALLMMNPDVIFVVPQGDEAESRAFTESLFKEDGWCELDAVKEGRIHYLPKDLYGYKPNARWAEAYRYLDALLYPGEAAN